jgi:hypothetical protein
MKGYYKVWNYSFRFDEEGFKTGDIDSMTMMGRLLDE